MYLPFKLLWNETIRVLGHPIFNTIPIPEIQPFFLGFPNFQPPLIK